MAEHNGTPRPPSEDGLAQAWADSSAPPESVAARTTAAVDRRLAQLLSRR